MSGFWDHNRVMRLRRLWGLGRTGTQIAKSLDCSRGAVMGKLDRLGLLGKPEKRGDRINAAAADAADAGDAR